MTDTPSNDVNVDNLIVGHFDGTLDEVQEKELATALATCSEAKQLFLSYMRMEGRLHSLGRDGFLREPIAEPARATEQDAPQSADVAPVIRSGRQRLRLLAASTSVAVCAAVVLMMFSGVLWPSSVSASSVLQRAKQAAAELIDRTYSVTLSDAGERSPSRELTINACGGGRFLVRPADGAYIMGSDGTDYWLTRAGGPVWVTSDSRAVARKLKGAFSDKWLFGIAASPNEPLLLEMAGLLSLIGRKHAVKLLDSASGTEHHVRATLRTVRGNAPEQVDFWADADSGVALRAEVRWSDGRQMRFELVESEKLPDQNLPDQNLSDQNLSDQWYHHREHAPGREIERLDPVNSL